MHDMDKILSGVEKLFFDNLPRIQADRFKIEWKPDGSPVTEADVFIENEVRAYLEQTIPGVAFVGEESFHNQTLDLNGWIAVLDPIDGTENFCSGLKEWGSSLSIWKGQEHKGSLLLMPELGESMRSGNLLRVPFSRIVGYSSSYHEEIGAGVSENPESRIMGCAVYNLFNVIRGSFARFVNPKGAHSWDLLGGVALAYEAGCEVLINGERYEGQFLEPGPRYRVDIRHRYDLHPGQGTID